MVEKVAHGIERLSARTLVQANGARSAVFLRPAVAPDRFSFYILKVVREPLILLNGGAVSRNYARDLQALRTGDLASTALTAIGVDAGFDRRGFALASVALGLVCDFLAHRETLPPSIEPGGRAKNRRRRPGESKLTPSQDNYVSRGRKNTFLKKKCALRIAGCNVRQ